mmetsp:Transcript_17125/g.30797  ORF Transcript_17125/g.30797 Transcript_17125/m.30797 type:complete len:218 (+) Transcript_17125:525-1178(+)
MIQQFEDIGSWLMDDDSNGMSQTGKFLQCRHERIRSGCIQSRRGFIKQQQGWPYDQFGRHGTSFSFSTTNPGNVRCRCTNQMISYMQQSQFVHGFFDQGLDLRIGRIGRRFQSCRKVDRLFDGQIAQQQVVLPYHTDHLFGQPSFVAVDFDNARDILFGVWNQSCHDRCETGLATSAGSHPCRQLIRIDLCIDIVENDRSLLLLLLLVLVSIRNSSV